MGNNRRREQRSAKPEPLGRHATPPRAPQRRGRGSEARSLPQGLVRTCWQRSRLRCHRGGHPERSERAPQHPGRQQQLARHRIRRRGGWQAEQASEAHVVQHIHPPVVGLQVVRLRPGQGERAGLGPKEGRRGGRAPAARLLAERFRPELLAHKLDGIEVVAEPRALLGQPAARGAGCSRRVRHWARARGCIQ